MRIYCYLTILISAALAAAPQQTQPAAAPQTQPPGAPPGQQPVPATATRDGSKEKDKEGAPPSVATVKAWNECDEYISAPSCKVTVNLGNAELPPDPAHNQYGTLKPRAHWDVQVQPFQHLRNTQRLGNAVVLLVNSSPFLSCTVSAVPANPARDLSTNIGSLLTSVAGIGAPPLTAQAIPPSKVAKTPGLKQFFDKAKALADAAARFPKDVSDAYKEFLAVQKNDWQYSFANDAAATAAKDRLSHSAQAFLNNLDKLPQLQKDFDVLSADVTAYEAANPGLPDAPDLNQQLNYLKANLEALKAYAANYADKEKLVRQYVDFLAALPTTGLTEQVLPMAYFASKQVTETVTCKDAISTNPAFDNIIFIAYYEALPHFDISVGAIASLLGGRQTSTVSAPFTPAQAAACVGITGCGPSTELTYKVRSGYQFIPTVLVEWRWANFHCPWARNGTPWHPFGYVCSIGIAGGPAINPNNGGPAAEVFAGLSIGIQRFSILIGAHRGRYQEYGGGFYAGETFTSGTSVTPLTVYRWATHPAFGITYRIPIR
jgi:hypothetical protein